MSMLTTLRYDVAFTAIAVQPLLLITTVGNPRTMQTRCTRKNAAVFTTTPHKPVALVFKNHSDKVGLHKESIFDLPK
ncbi:hypothetical protein XFEB_00063 [Xylella fastidiosa EB92.1]|nr:hypothetical protein XFEB_00063 [Xylella fastidiosa EB92.1]